ncbi:hypothetical protein PspLS_10154 [Pyricularia sp. CBS 133598]|nr:hypothetical protein PspLS_10154 [Pyricularia sp. CBS 133598]
MGEATLAEYFIDAASTTSSTIVSALDTLATNLPSRNCPRTTGIRSCFRRPRDAKGVAPLRRGRDVHAAPLSAASLTTACIGNGEKKAAASTRELYLPGADAGVAADAGRARDSGADRNVVSHHLGDAEARESGTPVDASQYIHARGSLADAILSRLVDRVETTRRSWTTASQST